MPYQQLCGLSVLHRLLLGPKKRRLLSLPWPSFTTTITLLPPCVHIYTHVHRCIDLDVSLTTLSSPPPPLATKTIEILKRWLVSVGFNGDITLPCRRRRHHFPSLSSAATMLLCHHHRTTITLIVFSGCFPASVSFRRFPP